jgi:hypothetical protein
VRPLVVRRCDRCWDVVPWACSGEHLPVRTLDVSFWFGRPRDAAAPAPARVVVEMWPIDGEEPVQRVSLGGGEALRLARILVRLVDDRTFVERARNARRRLASWVR